MERAGLDDLVVFGFRFFSTLLGVRVASFTAAALGSVGHGFVFVCRWRLAGCCCFGAAVRLLAWLAAKNSARLARGGDEHFLVAKRARVE